MLEKGNGEEEAEREADLALSNGGREISRALREHNCVGSCIQRRERRNDGGQRAVERKGRKVCTREKDAKQVK